MERLHNLKHSARRSVVMLRFLILVLAGGVSVGCFAGIAGSAFLSEEDAEGESALGNLFCPKGNPEPLRSRLPHSPRCSSPLLTAADGRPHRHGRDTLRTRERRMHTATRRGSPGANVVLAAAAPLLGNAEAATITAIAGGPGEGPALSFGQQSVRVAVL